MRVRKKDDIPTKGIFCPSDRTCNLIAHVLITHVIIVPEVSLHYSANRLHYEFSPFSSDYCQ
jgi:hypothetical protein